MAATATTRAVTLVALLAALGRPVWWILALAGFLVRGGIVVFLLAVVTLPSPLAISNLLSPIVTPIYLGSIGPGLVLLIGTAVATTLAWLFAATWFAAATEVVLARDARAVAGDEGLPVASSGGSRRLLITRATFAHLVALVPLGVAIGVGAIGILDVAYRELVNPTDASPIVPRVVAGAWLPVCVIIVTWVLGEIVGGFAARRVVLLDESVLPAVGRAALDLVRRPVGTLLVPLVTTVVLALDLVAVLLVLTIVWSDVRDRLNQPSGDVVATSLALLTFGGAWCLALIVTGLIASWRSVAMSFETDRVAATAPSRPGTFGASAHHLSGG